jgi:hypothetical protein
MVEECSGVALLQTVRGERRLLEHCKVMERRHKAGVDHNHHRHWAPVVADNLEARMNL